MLEHTGLDMDTIFAIMTEEKGNQKETIKFSADRIRKYFPKNTTPKQMEDFIIRLLALDAARAAEMVGMPEARIPLAHATVYLATAPKSNSAYMGINAAMNDVRNGKTLAVPEHLRTPTRKKMTQDQRMNGQLLQTCRTY